ncbi:MAG TPA: hypothetical protein VFL83_22740 [Anaeromyxobacter sp.]|nr:hypothetical protein [Anaeromyxobacter sp.]
MARKRSSASPCLGALLLLLSSGCSLAVMKPAPSPVLEPDVPARCTTSILPPVLDLGGAAAAGSISFVALFAPYGSDDVHGRIALASVAAAGAVTFLVSSVAGLKRTSRCVTFRELNERCVGGDLEACQALTPGWTPPPVAPRRAPPAEPAPAVASASPQPRPAGPAPPVPASGADAAPVASAAAAPPPRARRLGAALRLGYAHPLGDLQGGTPLDAAIDGMLPAQLDVTYEWIPDLPVGAYASWAFGRLGGDEAASCDATGASCSVGSLRLGLQAARVFRRAGARLVPWVGAGIGLEFVNFRRSGQYSTGFDGFEALLQGGAQYRLRERLSLGPYLQLSVGEYRSMDGRGIEDRRPHGWVAVGARATVGR